MDSKIEINEETRKLIDASNIMNFNNIKEKEKEVQ